MKLFLFGCLVISTAHAASPASQLLAALNQRDSAAVESLVAQERVRLGDQAGVPEVADTYQPVPPDTAWIDPARARRGFTPHFDRLLKMAAGWKPGIDPSRMTEPLRAPASVISGCLAVAKAGLEGGADALNLAGELADFLIWTQEQAGAGCFPFPAARGTSNARAMQAATRFLQKAGQEGKWSATVRNGWAFEDHGDGGLQFDNAECGVALFELHEVTRDPRHLASARQAADWALSRPLCANWNYNAFSVHLLAKAHAVTKEARYLESALQKARLGVIPGQLASGPRAGRWLDAHNARPAYHYIMMSALAQLASELPREHSDRPLIVASLKLGLGARNGEIITLGVMTKDKAMEALLLTRDVFAGDPEFLDTTHTRAALQILGGHVSEEYRRGKLPLGPRAWGRFLALAAAGQPSPAP
jgi:hypothetical protein